LHSQLENLSKHTAEEMAAGFSGGGYNLMK